MALLPVPAKTPRKETILADRFQTVETSRVRQDWEFLREHRANLDSSQGVISHMCGVTLQRAHPDNNNFVVGHVTSKHMLRVATFVGVRCRTRSELVPRLLCVPFEQTSRPKNIRDWDMLFQLL